MLSSRFAPWHVPLFAAKYAWLTLRHRPILVHFEVTMRCNARCDFCDYWKTDPSARAAEAQSFADAARFFSPIMITFTGGEPLLRRDLEELVAGVARAVRLRYIALITHGGMLTLERARSLWDAGVRVSVNTDDPGFFGCTLTGEYAIAGQLLDLDRGGYARLARNSVEGSFAPDALKAQVHAEIDDWEWRPAR